MNGTVTLATLEQKIVHKLYEIFGPNRQGLHEPFFGGNESTYLQECLASTFVSSVGPFVDRFESDLANFTGAKYAVAVVNGTAALHVALRLSGVKPDDEVLLPALTFVATANAISYCGAIPHFVDSNETTLGLDPDKLRDYLAKTTEFRDGQCINRRTGRVIRAVVPMHTFGHPVDMETLLAVAQDYHLVVVEDAAESLGSMYHGQHTGTFGRIGILSFNGNKTITTGGGGAILTNDADLAKKAKHLTTTAKVPHKWAYWHDEIGYNYRMPNLNAALGCAQLEQLPKMLEAKRRIFECYQSAFASIMHVRIMEEVPGCRSNYWLQTLILENADLTRRDAILTATNEAGYMTRPVWTLLNQLPRFKSSPRMPLDTALKLEAQLINLPSSSHMRIIWNG